MGLKLRLTVMNFLQFFVWGAWLITIANYWFGTKGWAPDDFGLIFMTLGISSLVMPTLLGILADRFFNAEKIFGIVHIFSGIAIFGLTLAVSPGQFFWVMLVAMMFYMPTIALTNTISYSALKDAGHDVVKVFPGIRVWGTIGFIAAMWVTNLSGNKATEVQFYISAAASLVLGIYSFTLPKCPPNKAKTEKKSFIQAWGLDAFKLMGNYKMLIFFLFSMLLGAALQLTNMYGDVFLDEFKHVAEYADSVVVKYSTIVMSISQGSETLFILAIPFFLKKFGIKKVMLMSMFAWVLRFGLFSYGNPGSFLWMIILSNIIYGMAFDFFNISGSLFVETETPTKYRASAQGLFMMMTNGFGAIIGSVVSGFVITKFFILDNGDKDWSGIWMTFAIYALVVALLFMVLFRHKHNPKDPALQNVSH
ncbi:MAG: nucleoside permease [Bacteroidales bacterium]|nr:nucleoside permease [Bacteroidales bacterium]